MEPVKINMPNESNKIRGCGPIALFVILSFWVIVISGIDLFANWSLEQSLVENSTAIPDVRWIIHGVCALVLLLSLLIIFFFVKIPRIKHTLGIWVLASSVALLLVPAKKLFITDQQGTTAYQILILALFSAILLLANRKQRPPQIVLENRPSIFGLVALLVGALSIPWLLWGALGSISDTVLYVVLGIAFAFLVIQVLFPFLFVEAYAAENEPSVGEFLLDGLIGALFFIILLTGLGQNGSQLVLVLVLPISSWVITGFAMIGHSSTKQAKLSVGLISGSVLAFPLLFFDADELSLLITGTPGETVTWATRSAFTTLGVLFAVLILFVVFFRIKKGVCLSKSTNMVFALVSLLAIFAVYFLAGQPGFYGEKIFVVMKNQADLTAVKQIPDPSARRQAVYAELVKTALTSQTDIRKQLDQWHLSYTPYYLVDGIEVDAGPFYTMLLQKRNDVDRVLPSPHLRPLPEAVPLTNSQPVDQPGEPAWNLKMIGVDQVWQELKITGKGIVIGQTDTGVDGTHPELKTSYRGAQGGNDYNWLDSWNHTVSPTDAEGHGTATLGLITGKEIGIAPDAQWIGCVNLARDLGNPAVYLNCMQFMLAPYPQAGNSFSDGKPEKGAMIINNSWGCPKVEGCDAKIFQSAADALEAAGVFMSVAAGNTGNYGCSTVTDPPAIYGDVFTAGSVNQAGNVSDFSSLGPVNVDGSNRIKPDLLAPGEGVVSSFPGNAYIKADGTSFAAPHVSGVVALMWSANPKLVGNIELTMKLLEETASPYQGTIPACVTSTSLPSDASGYGILNAYAAVKAAIAVK